MGRKLGGCAPLVRGELGPHLTECGQADAYLRAKFHLDPSKRLSTIHQRHRQTDRTDRQERQTDRQRTDNVGRTILQMVAQKRTSGQSNLT